MPLIPKDLTSHGTPWKRPVGTSKLGAAGSSLPGAPVFFRALFALLRRWLYIASSTRNHMATHMTIDPDPADAQTSL